MAEVTLSADASLIPKPTNSADRSKFMFKWPWFEDVRPLWEELTVSLRGKKLQILEIGCFEGCSTTWILDNLMAHPESHLTAIDTFEGSMEHESQDLVSLEDRFRLNVSKCEHADRLRVMKASSEDALLTLRHESARFDFIYIDASHVAVDVLHDAVLCWRMLNLYGKLVFDDFAWKMYVEDCYNPRIAIMSFVQCAAQEVETADIGAQMWVTKVPNRVPATRSPAADLFYNNDDARKNDSSETSPS